MGHLVDVNGYKCPICELEVGTIDSASHIQKQLETLSMEDIKKVTCDNCPLEDDETCEHYLC